MTGPLEDESWEVEEIRGDRQVIVSVNAVQDTGLLSDFSATLDEEDEDGVVTALPQTPIQHLVRLKTGKGPNRKAGLVPEGRSKYLHRKKLKTKQAIVYGRTIAQGKFGKVHVAIDAKGSLCALKIMRIAAEQSEGFVDAKDTPLEAQALTAIGWPDIEVYSFETATEHYGQGQPHKAEIKHVIRMPWCAGDGLAAVEHYLDGPSRYALQPAESDRENSIAVALVVARGLVDGIIDLAAIGRASNDVKFDNTLILASGEVKISDMGLVTAWNQLPPFVERAHCMPERIHHYQLGGPPDILHMGRSDLWAAGVDLLRALERAGGLLESGLGEANLDRGVSDLAASQKEIDATVLRAMEANDHLAGVRTLRPLLERMLAADPDERGPLHAIRMDLQLHPFHARGVGLLADYARTRHAGALKQKDKLLKDKKALKPKPRGLFQRSPKPAAQKKTPKAKKKAPIYEIRKSNSGTVVQYEQPASQQSALDYELPVPANDGSTRGDSLKYELPGTSRPIIEYVPLGIEEDPEATSTLVGGKLLSVPGTGTLHKVTQEVPPVNVQVNESDLQEGARLTLINGQAYILERLPRNGIRSESCADLAFTPYGEDEGPPDGERAWQATPIGDAKYRQLLQSRFRPKKKGSPR